MDRYFMLLTVLACAQGGPYVWRPRPVAKPLVAEGQWRVHERLLSAEKLVLQTSLGLSRLAESVTSQAYRLMYEAEARLEALKDRLQQDARLFKPLAPGCADLKTLQRKEEKITEVSGRLYQCTHGLSDLAASFEVNLTQVLIDARAQIWNVQQAMWFCQKFQAQVDSECLTRLVEEGFEVSTLLPVQERLVRDQAEAERVQCIDRLSECLALGISEAEEIVLSTSHEWRQCVQNSQDSEDGVHAEILYEG